MEIKNLDQLKEALQQGAKFKVIWHWRPDEVDVIREVRAVKEDGIYSVNYEDAEAKISRANNGKGSWLAFGEPRNWRFQDEVITYSFKGKKTVMKFTLL